MILKKPTNEIIKSVKDENGNIICTKNNGKRIIVYLKVPKFLKIKKIGTINIAKKTLTIKRTREKHLFRKYNAYGLNVYLLRNAKTFDKIKIIDNYNTFYFSLAWANENVKYLTFSKAGYELQGFISLQQLEQFII
jgi:hypothetical protein